MNALELYFRLAFAIALLLAPGWCLARALGVRSVSATLAWSLTLLFGALVVTKDNRVPCDAISINPRSN